MQPLSNYPYAYADWLREIGISPCEIYRGYNQGIQPFGDDPSDMNEEGDDEDVPDLKLGVQSWSTNNGYQGTSKHDNGSCSRINNFVLTSQRVESDILEETPNAGPSEH